MYLAAVAGAQQCAASRAEVTPFGMHVDNPHAAIGWAAAWMVQVCTVCNDAAELDADAPDDIATGAHNARTALRPAIGERIMVAVLACDGEIPQIQWSQPRARTG